MIVDSGGILRQILTININDVSEPTDCIADPQFSSATDILCHFPIVYFQQLCIMKKGRHISPADVGVIFIIYKCVFI